ncbi:hypothetical protein LEP1GSC058_1977 [Leptospira fainei serovar Hurstbridge str. BUT 6]|uniref:Uncharacterized protein n=1 Tax=Leptospira fainei serovar Hurstbridge str. BUT 6 TaxID=1193011 RepID=S3VGQ0_9LEPT|nr:hypothetical protein LEP1GSC058_1977 [Leptospira fainei serovar Hurstbridge str. BUT 6]
MNDSSVKLEREKLFIRKQMLINDSLGKNLLRESEGRMRFYINSCLS